jgi:surfactin synthase thioesterase subunit
VRALQLIRKMISMKRNLWLVRTANSSRRLRLFCFPYAGGSAASFARWQEQIGNTIDVCALNPPGRGARFGETPYRSMPDLITEIARIIAGQDDLPFAFFGHSLGGIVAFEVASYCSRNGLPMPNRLFVSGCDAPQVRRSSRKLHLSTDEELITALKDFSGTPPEILRDRDLMALLLPTVRADFSLAETYKYHPRPPLHIPISVLAGRLEEFATSDPAMEWQKETTNVCDLHWFPGGHFFINQERTAVLNYLRAELNELHSQLPTDRLRRVTHACLPSIDRSELGKR